MHKSFNHSVKVYYEDTDSGGVVYYANYLKYLERARTEALCSIGFSNREIQDKFKTLIIVKSCNIEYKKPAYLEDELTVNTFIKSANKTSLIMSQIILKENNIGSDNLVVESLIHLVFINKDSKPVKIPDEIYSKFKPYILSNTS